MFASLNLFSFLKTMTDDYINDPSLLKIDLMLRGLNIDPETKDYEYLLNNKATGKSIDLELSSGALVNVPYNEDFTKNSPYILTKRKGKDTFVDCLTDNKVDVKVNLVETPRFYRKQTKSGKFFSEIAKVHGSYAVITPEPYCEFFDSEVECKYCAGNFDLNAHNKVKPFTVDEVLETVEAILKEKASDIIYLSIGFTEGDDGGIEFLTPYIKAIKKHFNCLVAVEALPPKENHWIDETYAVGADSVLYNLEIFDKELFEMICPGRAKLVGRDRYLEALKYAAKIFPNGTVASHLIVGLEMPGSTAMGVEYLTNIGVVPILPVYRPSGGKAIRIEPLTTEIIVPVYKKLYSEIKKNKINMNWVRQISSVTTPIESRLIAGDDINIFEKAFEIFKSKFGLKAALGLSAIRRSLRVQGHNDDDNKRSN